MPSLRLAITADLHWGHGPVGDTATRQLHDFLTAQPPDVLILAGDIGVRKHFVACLGLFSDLSCHKLLVPGNHDIWVDAEDDRGDSLQVYREWLPAVAKDHDFHYLDQAPFLLPEVDLALVGCINWYDYSWSLDLLKQHVPDWEQRLREKRFTRGRHNDGRFVRWGPGDVGFTATIVECFRTHLQQALAAAPQVLVVTHHPPLPALGFSGEGTTDPDRLLWAALCGNRSIEEVLLEHRARIPLVFCGHTHREREAEWGSMRGFNIGGDYRWKRLLLVDWPAGTVTAHSFGEIPATE